MNPAAFGSVLPGACDLGQQGIGAGDYGQDRIAKTSYDLAGRVTGVATALHTGDSATEVATTYTANGLVETVTDGEGNRTTYEYDGHDRLARTRYPVTTKGAGTSSTADYEQLGYESLAGGGTSGLAVAFRNRANQTIGFGYDALGRLASKDRPGSEPDVTYGYDLLGRMTSASQTGHSLGFTYDALGRKLSETGPLGTIASEWDLAGRRTKLTWPDGYWVGYDYLVTGEMTAIRESGATSGLGVLATFAYDQPGRRTLLTRGNGTTTGYGYDSASRLSQLAHDIAGAGTSHDLTLGFTYNPASQIATATRSNDLYAWTAHGSGTTSTTTNGLNQIANWVGSVGYDPKGNIVTNGTYGFTYSSENLLTSFTNSATGAVQASSTFAYDPLMRLAVINSSTDSFDASLAYDGQEIVFEALSNGRTRRYVFGPGTDEPLTAYLTQSSGTFRNWYYADERGSIIGQTDDSGAPLGPGGPASAFDEYGVGAGTSRFRYTGQYWLGDHLHYYKARMYEARLGRFLQPDPIGYEAGMNLYAYVGGDPVNFTDPLGLEEEPEQEITITGKGLKDRDSAQPSMGAAVGGGTYPTLVTRAELLPGRFNDPDVTCGQGGCDEEVVITKRPNKRWIIVNGRYIENGQYTQPWYARYMEYGFVLGPPLLALGAVIAPEAIAVEGPRRAVFQYGRGRLFQIRFGQDKLRLRLDIRKPNTHVNIQTRTRNIHWPKGK
jgi:RHS repeat-associated protein